MILKFWPLAAVSWLPWGLLLGGVFQYEDGPAGTIELVLGAGGLSVRHFLGKNLFGGGRRFRMAQQETVLSNGMLFELAAVIFGLSLLGSRSRVCKTVSDE